MRRTCTCTPRPCVHKVPPGIAPETAVLFNPLGAGVRWGVTLPRTTIGSKIVVLGPGQRGLACAIAAKLAGASLVIVTGLTRDRHKLDLAIELGADVAIDVEREDLVARVRELTGGGADIVVDVSAVATQPVVDAVECVRPGGTIVLGGVKGTHGARLPERQDRAAGHHRHRRAGRHRTRLPRGAVDHRAATCCRSTACARISSRSPTPNSQSRRSRARSKAKTPSTSSSVRDRARVTR